MDDAYFSDRNDSFAEFWPGDEFSRLRVSKELLFVEQGTIGGDLRWICRFLGSLLACECQYFLSSIFGVYRPHMKLYLELLLSTVVYLALFTSSMSHVIIGWAKILASTMAIIALK